MEAHEQTRLDAWLTRTALAQADALIVHSRADERKIRKLLPRSRVYVHEHPIYDVFPEGDFNEPTLRQSFNLPENDPVILFFGYVRKYKGLHCLLKAVSLIPREKKVFLLVVGEFYDPIEQYLEQIETLKIEDRIKIIPGYAPNEQVYQFFRLARAVVLPYLSASQSGIAQIAWSFHCPIIATRVGGLPDIIPTPAHGLLVDPDNPQALSEAIVKILDPLVSATIRQTMSCEKQRFSWTGMRETIETIEAELRP